MLIRTIWKRKVRRPFVTKCEIQLKHNTSRLVNVHPLIMESDAGHCISNSAHRMDLQWHEWLRVLLCVFVVQICVQKVLIGIKCAACWSLKFLNWLSSSAGIEPTGNRVLRPAVFTVDTFSAGQGQVTVYLDHPDGTREEVKSTSPL